MKVTVKTPSLSSVAQQNKFIKTYGSTPALNLSDFGFSPGLIDMAALQIVVNQNPKKRFKFDLAGVWTIPAAASIDLGNYQGFEAVNGATLETSSTGDVFICNGTFGNRFKNIRLTSDNEEGNLIKQTDGGSLRIQNSTAKGKALFTLTEVTARHPNLLVEKSKGKQFIQGFDLVKTVYPEGRWTFTNQFIVNAGSAKYVFEGAGQDKTFFEFDTHVNPDGSGNQFDVSLFRADNQNDVTFQKFTVQNIGQREGLPTDYKYYDTLNGVPVTYSRRQNKRINRGSAFYMIACTNVTIRNITSRETGSLVTFSGGDIAYIGHNKIDGWGEVGIYPVSNSTVEWNEVIQWSPEMNQDDINQDVGTSHGIYITTGFSNVTIRNNQFDRARVNGIQCNTSTGNPFEDILIHDNTFQDCYRTTWFGGNGGGTVIFRDNQVYGSRLLSDQGFAGWDVTYDNNLYDGQGETRIGIVANGPNNTRAWIKNNAFRNINGTENAAGVRMTPQTGLGQILIEGNDFEASNSYAVYFPDPISAFTGLVTIQADNKIKCRVRFGDTPGVDPQDFTALMTGNDVAVSGGQSLIANMTADIVANDFLIGAPVVCNEIFATGREALFDNNNFLGEGLGFFAVNSNGNYSFINNTSTGPSRNMGTSTPNRDENNTGF